MSAQYITTELKTWIVAQAHAGYSAEVTLDAMKASGWDEAIAMEALESTLQEHLAGGGKTLLEPTPVQVPVLQAAEGATVVTVDGRDVNIVVSLKEPRIVVLGNLLSADECDRMIALAAQRLARSETVQVDTGASEVNDARTSDGMFFERGEFDVCVRLEARLAALFGWPVENGEGLQVLRYRPGAEYKPHYDYFDIDRPGTPAILKRGGQRVASIVCYLNTPTRGGATTFPDVGLEVAPVRGHAVFFSYDRPLPSTRSLHGGAPVLEGEKWVATKWLRERRFV